MADENNFAKEVEKELLKDTTRPAFKAVTTASTSAPAPVDSQRRTKQMMEQFQKIKEGLKADLKRTEEERDRLFLEIDDLELAIRVIASAQAMLDVGE